MVSSSDGEVPERPVSKPMAPTWDLALVLDALCESPIETFRVSFPTRLPAHGFGVGQERWGSVHPSYLDCGPGDSKVMLHPNAAFAPKVMPMSNRSLAFPSSCSLSHLLRLLPVNKRGAMACVRCTLYAHIWVGPRIPLKVAAQLTGCRRILWHVI